MRAALGFESHGKILGFHTLGQRRIHDCCAAAGIGFEQSSCYRSASIGRKEPQFVDLVRRQRGQIAGKGIQVASATLINCLALGCGLLPAATSSILVVPGSRSVATVWFACSSLSLCSTSFACNETTSRWSVEFHRSNRMHITASAIIAARRNARNPKVVHQERCSRSDRAAAVARRGSAAMADISRCRNSAGGFGPAVVSAMRLRSPRSSSSSRRQEAHSSRCLSSACRSAPPSDPSAVQRQIIRELFVHAHAANTFRSDTNPVRILVLMVPSGSPVFLGNLRMCQTLEIRHFKRGPLWRRHSLQRAPHFLHSPRPVGIAG